MNSRFEAAIARFDAENAKDPHHEFAEGKSWPRELLYARRLTDWVLKLEPDASEALRLAARCQHIRRWEIPRSEYAADRAGYHRWRTRLKTFHAEVAATILQECGYDEEMIERVRKLNLKEGFPAEPEARTLEDALCLVFLEFQSKEFAGKTDPKKTENALTKIWGKMTEKGRQAAAMLPVAEEKHRP